MESFAKEQLNDPHSVVLGLNHYMPSFFYAEAMSKKNRVCIIRVFQLEI